MPMGGASLMKQIREGNSPLEPGGARESLYGVAIQKLPSEVSGTPLHQAQCSDGVPLLQRSCVYHQRHIAAQHVRGIRK